MIGQLPWVGKFVKSLPGVGTDVKGFRAFAVQQFLLRKKEGSGTKDLFYHLVRSLEPHPLLFSTFSVMYSHQADEGGIEKEPIPTPVVLSDSVLVIVGGQRPMTYRTQYNHTEFPVRVRYNIYGSVLPVLLPSAGPQEVPTTPSRN